MVLFHLLRGVVVLIIVAFRSAKVAFARRFFRGAKGDYATVYRVVAKKNLFFLAYANSQPRFDRQAQTGELCVWCSGKKLAGADGNLPLFLCAKSFV